MDRDSPPPTKPENKRPLPVPGVPGFEIARADVRKRHPGAERSTPPERSISPFPELRQPVRIEIEQAAQSMRPRTTHAVAKLLAVPAVVAALIAGLTAGSAWLDARAKREVAEAQLAEARAKQLAELGPRVDAIAADLAALKATGDPREIERMRRELTDVVDRMKAAERDITKLYRARPGRAPD